MLLFRDGIHRRHFLRLGGLGLAGMTLPQLLAWREASAAAAKPRSSARAQTAAAIEDFLALPTYDPTIATDGLRIIRLEGRGSDLRLAGAPVSEELSERRVVADFMVGHDGTPYAVRFVQ